jgi:hypothetical protein
MSTPTTSSLSTPATLNQSGNGVPVDQALKLAQGLKPNNSGMTVGTQLPQITAQPVDRRTIEGSTPGDHRAPANTSDITAFAKNPPCPRDPVRQSQVVSSKLQAMDAPVPVPVTGESLASNS